MHPVVQSFTRSFAIISALFITVISSKARSQHNCETGFLECAQPLSVLTDSGLSFVTNKEDLERICPDFRDALRCIRTYTRHCMSYDQGKHFKKLFNGTTMMIHDLCRNGRYQEEYLSYAPCMKIVEAETGQCFSKYSRKMQQIQSKTEEEERELLEPDVVTYEKRKREAATKGIRNVCCSFQEYLQCSTSTMRQQCGEDAERFSRNFLDRMSSAIIHSHCYDYGPRECGLELQYWSEASSSNIQKISLISTAVLLIITYFLR